MGNYSIVRVFYLVFLIFLFGCSTPQLTLPDPDNVPSPNKPKPEPKPSPDPYACPPGTIIEIPDKREFYPRLIARFGKHTGDPITCGDLQRLTEFGAMSGSTIDLTGIEYAINLEGLSFANVHPKSLSPLKGLKKLKAFGIYVDAIPMPGGFDCDEGGFRSIIGLDSVSSLSNLEELTLQGYNISDLSFLKDLTKLKKLNLRCNLIDDVSPLVNLTQLEFLHLGGNRITDINPLSELTKLTELKLDRNCPENLEALKNLTMLKTLLISGDTSDNNGPTYCPLDNFQPLENLSTIEDLEIINTNFSDTSLLLNFPKLKQIGLAQNLITDITPIATIITRDILAKYESWPTSINLEANRITNKDLQDFSNQLSTLKPNQYALFVRYNCLDLSQTQTIDVELV
jgi:internalin A